MNNPPSNKKNAPDTGKEFYLVEEVAKKLRVCNMTIYRYIKSRRLNAYNLGKGFRIEKEEFENFLKKSSQQLSAQK
ncbi:MAG: helix-turn-helix domain-containing protein [Candidatus Moraniibacteriota bacterium]|nr:MAG: helix-turn-helix domain-containing protein [Candidatus Moranbacteria bacterium]